jgi:hypothetical protein
MKNLEMLQYDLLYGKRYAYGDKADESSASEIEMGINDVTVDACYLFGDKVHIYGDNFSKWSKVYVNGEKVSTTYESGQVLTIPKSVIESGDTLTVCQVGSSSTVFRESNTVTFIDPNADEEMTDEEKEADEEAASEDDE